MKALLLHFKNTIVSKKISVFSFEKLLFLFLMTGMSITTNAQCSPILGDQTSYGAGSWIGYVYSAINTSNPPTNAFTTTYRGYITQPEIFNQDIGSGSISGTNLCGTYSDQFSIRFKMQKNFAPGNYSFQVGGDDGYRLSFDGGATFPISKWNDQGYTISTYTYYLSGPTNLVLEYYEQGGVSRVSYSYGICSTPSTDATSISGITTICSGNSTTLTAVGGTTAINAVYQWGTGTVIGSNIITGQTSASITVSPSTTTTYWVNKVDPAPCTNSTAGMTQTVTVNPISTAPTAITGGTTLCLGSSVTLTATGGTLATSGSYQWGTGSTVGLNIITGQTGVSLTDTPNTSTTYWVRRVDTTPCANTTTGVTTTVSVNTPAGDQTTYGNTSWIGYVYSAVDGANPPSNVFSTTYRGYITQTEQFNQDIGTGSLSGTNLCGTYSDQFSIRFKMQENFTSGYYTFTVGGDDGYRLSLDGGATFVINNFNDHAYTTTTSASIYLSGNTNLVLEYYEQGGYSRVSFNYTSCTNFSSAPTAISGTSSLCNGAGGTTLTATGGYAAPGATYQWGTGSVIGSNIIAGVSYNGYYINPTTTTTYWVRRVDGAPCNLTTNGVTLTVTVNTPSTQPTTISGSTSICSGNSTTLTASGGTLGTGAVYQWGTGYSAGVNTIVGATGPSIVVSPTVNSGYWVRRMDPAPCNSNTGQINTTINVATAPTNPTSISSTTSTCSGTSIALTAVGGNAGTNGTYQWGTGTTIGSNIIAGQTYYIMYVNPTITTTYWVRIIDTAPCNATTAGVTQTITVSTPSTAPTTISGSTTTCSGANLTLTASGGTMGTGAVYQWGSGGSVGSNIITGQTSASIIVNPTSSGSYWVRRIDPSPCNTQTSGTTIYITVTSPSTAPTSISGAGAAACAGGNTTLTAVGGSSASGAVYQWGTGSTVGSNVIAGQTGVSITVSPTSTTTYWVRRYDAGCAYYTTGVTTTVLITAPPGNPAVAGTNVWNVYGYSTPDITLATAVYAGYYTTNTLSFDTQTGTNNWGLATSPSNSAGWSGCPVPNDNFTMVAKRLGFPCGTYTLAMQNWDDVAQVYLNGVLIWSAATWSGSGNFNVIVGSYNLDATSQIEIRLTENTGNANINMTLTNTNIASTAPTSISGTTTLCNGSSTTLTATGGTLGTSGSYQWGTGSTIGSNVIAGQTSASLTVSPTANTTYWVNRVDTVCSNATTGITQLVTVIPATVAGTLSSTSSTICKGRTPNPIILSGNTGNVIKWQYANDAAFTLGVTDIASTATSLTSAIIGALTTTRYFRAVVQSGSCAIANTPALGITVPTAITYNGSWTSMPDPTTPVIIASNYTLPSDLNVCSCQVTGTATITVPAGITFVVQRDINVAATANIVIQDQGSLVQVDDNASNIGNITFKRNTTPLKQYDYTYWSSPLAGQTLSQFGTPSLYYSFNASINNWASEVATNIMTAAKGYIVRVPNNLNFSTPQVVLTTINGTPNNGIINASIVKGTGTTYNLIGNPYPSAIDIDQFLLDPTNSTIVNGTIYLWTHNTAISNTIPGTGIYNYTKDDYAKYNITGGVKTGSTAITGGVTPNGKIAAGQGFFIEANSALANGSYVATFNNSMRIAGNNNMFFKSNNTTVQANSQNTMSSSIEKHRVWLNISNAGGAYDETLVGYIQGATNGIDSLFDGNTMPAGNVVSLYSVLGTTNLAIQGRALPFNDSDVVPIGYSTTLTGDFTIALENFDGLFNNQNIYLLDKTTNTYYDLKAQSVTFNSASGTFNDRFELHYTSSLLSNHETDFTANDIQIIKKDKHIAVKATNQSITAIQVFDILGKSIYTANKINKSEFYSIDFSIAPQILLVKVTLDNNETVTKKVLMN